MDSAAKLAGELRSADGPPGFLDGEPATPAL